MRGCCGIRGTPASRWTVRTRRAAFLALQHSGMEQPRAAAQARDELVQNPPALLEAFLRQHNGIAQDLSSSAGSGPGIGGYLQAKGPRTGCSRAGQTPSSPPKRTRGSRSTADRRDDAEFNGWWGSVVRPGAPAAVPGLRCTDRGGGVERHPAGQVRLWAGVVQREVPRGRCGHTYYLHHPSPKGFADLNQPATQDLLKAIRGSLTSKEGRAAHAASTSIATSPQEYQTLRHLMTDKFATGKQVLDAYRKSLENAGPCRRTRCRRRSKPCRRRRTPT
jgi:hypothetical protein